MKASITVATDVSMKMIFLLLKIITTFNISELKTILTYKPKNKCNIYMCPSCLTGMKYTEIELGYQTVRTA